MTISESLNFFPKIKRADLLLFAFFSIVFLFIYGAMLVKIGYRPDELDTIMRSDALFSTSLECYRANGRWFHALWRWTIGTNPHSVAQGLTACVFFSMNLIVLIRLLGIKCYVTKAIFGLIYITLSQFAYVLELVYQADSIALGLLFVACAAYYIQKQGRTNYFASTLLLTFSLAIYQSLILNFCIIIMFIIYRMLSNNPWKNALLLILKSISCCLLSLIIYYIVGKLAVLLIYTSAETLESVSLYQSNYFIAGKIGFNNLNGLFGQLLYTLKELGKTLIYPKAYAGEWIYSSCWIAIFCLFLNIFKSQCSTAKKICRSCIILAIWLMPFFLILAFLNPNAMDSPNRLGEPLSLACLWTLAIPTIRWNKSKVIIFFSALAILMIKTANYVNDYTNSKRYVFEAQLSAYRQMEFEAVALASEANIYVAPQNLLLFRFHKDGYVQYDPLRHYPALTFINPNAAKQSLADHEEKLKEMSCWPRKNSIAIHKGKIIIKCDDSCYIDARKLK